MWSRARLTSLAAIRETAVDYQTSWNLARTSWEAHDSNARKNVRNPKTKSVSSTVPPHAVTGWKVHLVEYNLELCGGPRAAVCGVPPES